MFNSKGKMAPWACSMFTSERERNIALVHYGEDWSVCSVTASYNGKEVSMTSSFVGPIPTNLLEGEARYFLTKEEREDGSWNMSRTVIADDDWTPAEGLKEDFPVAWGAAAMFLRSFAEAELTMYAFEYTRFLQRLEEEENAEA